MVSEEERLKREIRIIREVIAQRKTRNQVGYSNWQELERDIAIPSRYEHLVDQNTEHLEDHLERLEADLDDLQTLGESSSENVGFQDEVEMKRGRRLNEEDDE
jgi:hypothetical protein